MRKYGLHYFSNSFLTNQTKIKNGKITEKMSKRKKKTMLLDICCFELLKEKLNIQIYFEIST